jgi:glycogen debranching enzyme
MSSELSDPRHEVTHALVTTEALFSVHLAPGEIWSLAIEIIPCVGPNPTPALPRSLFDASFKRIQAEHRQWEIESTHIWTDHEPLNALIYRSRQDLRLLLNHLPTGLLPVAGIPWFAVPFGRDSAITSLQTLCLNPDIAYGSLRFLALHQGQKVDPWRDEEPGKILHEIRAGELAALGEVPQTPYYGSVDSTPLFVLLFTELMRWTDDWAFAAEMRPHLDAALDWIQRFGDPDEDGLIEYQSQSAGGIHNQGWKDSYDAIAFLDGQFPDPPIAVVEVQGYAYAAEARMAEVYRRLGDVERAAACSASAAARKKRFHEAFWLEREQFYAMALDGEKRPVPSVSSNPGHCFLAGILDGPQAEIVARRLMEPDMLCGWGLRTLSSDYPTFNPLSYHNGSVWPHDNSLVVAGLRRMGYDDAALRIISEIFSAGFRLPDYRLPELFCGFSRDLEYFSAPAEYPVACNPQAWAAGSVFLMLQHLVGFEPDLPNGRITVRPQLLPWLNEINFANMRLGQRYVDLHIWRDGSRVRGDLTGADDLSVFIEDGGEV